MWTCLDVLVKVLYGVGVCSYCLSRVLKFDKNGKHLRSFGVGDFNVPHSLALAEELDLICVADRENMRCTDNNHLVDKTSLFKFTESSVTSLNRNAPLKSFILNLICFFCGNC